MARAARSGGPDNSLASASDKCGMGKGYDVCVECRIDLWTVVFIRVLSLVFEGIRGTTFC
jgi:hypothetical protein